MKELDTSEIIILAAAALDLIIVVGLVVLFLKL